MRDKRLPTSNGSFLYFLQKLHVEHLLLTLPFQIAHSVEIACRTNNLAELQNHLHGTARLVPEELAEARQPGRLIDNFAANKFESFMDVVGKNAVVWGPLALVNHNCAAKLGFGVVGKPGEGA
jgi:hypothetical protein